VSFGYGVTPQPFAQLGQAYAPQLQQVLQAVAQQLSHLNQLNQQQSQLLQQLIQAVPQQLQQIQHILQLLPQLIHQQSLQIHQQPAGGFGPWQQPFGGPPWSGAGIPQQATSAGQQGTGANLGFPILTGQSGPVM
jgi:hypothetical protein